MKRFTVWALALALCMLTAHATLAQGGGGGRGFGGQFGRGMGRFGGGGVALLGIPEVQKELKMTPAQIEKVKTKQTETQAATRDIMQKAGGPQALRDMSDEDRQKLFAQIQDIQKKAVNDVLNEDQQKRFHQLELQQSGARAFSNKEVKEALKITDEQTEKINGIQQEQMQAMRDAMQGIDFQNMSDEDRKKMQTKMAEMQKTTLEKTVAVLTPDQQKKWKEMVGAPFTFPAFGGGPRRNRPGNNNQNS